MSEQIARRCSCGTVLSTYNGLSVCASCERRQRSAPTGVVVSPWIWFRSDMRRALAEWDWRTVLTVVARECDITQTRLSELTTLSQAQISRLMSGTSQCYDIRTIGRIVDAIGAPRMLAGLSAVRQSSDSVVEQEVQEVNRRTLLSISLAVPFLAASSTGADQVSADEARRIRAVVPELYGLDDRIGGDAVCQVAAAVLSEVDTLLGRTDYGNPAGRDLQCAFAELAEMTGWLNCDAGRFDAARTYLGEALRAAQIADDLNLEVLALASMNTVSRYQGRPREAVQLIQLAQRRAAGWAPPRLNSLLAAREGVCWAQAGDGVGTRNALRRAAHLFDPAVGQDDPDWIAYFDSAELAARRATAAAYLGDTELAVTAMQSAVEGIDDRFQRNRAYYSVRLGLSLLDIGDRRRACEVVGTVLPLFAQVQSGRAHTRLNQFARRLIASKSPAGRGLIEQAHALGFTVFTDNA